MDTSRIQSAQATAEVARTAGPLAGSTDPGFQALLEKLERRAGTLASRELDNPDHLAGALDEARASLEEALELGRDLIEAFRQAHLTAG
jgi:hypothetical protein